MGFYSLGNVSHCSNFAIQLYRKAFLVNNSTYTEETLDVTNPFLSF